jgi:hypothetical protein
MEHVSVHICTVTRFVSWTIVSASFKARWGEWPLLRLTLACTLPLKIKSKAIP